MLPYNSRGLFVCVFLVCSCSSHVIEVENEPVKTGKLVFPTSVKEGDTRYLYKVSGGVPVVRTNVFDEMKIVDFELAVMNSTLHSISIKAKEYERTMHKRAVIQGVKGSKKRMRCTDGLERYHLLSTSSKNGNSGNNSDGPFGVVFNPLVPLKTKWIREVCRIKNLRYLRISKNILNPEHVKALHKCQSLEMLDIEESRFDGDLRLALKRLNWLSAHWITVKGAVDFSGCTNLTSMKIVLLGEYVPLRKIRFPNSIRYLILGDLPRIQQDMVNLEELVMNTPFGTAKLHHTHKKLRLFFNISEKKMESTARMKNMARIRSDGNDFILQTKTGTCYAKCKSEGCVKQLAKMRKCAFVSIHGEHLHRLQNADLEIAALSVKGGSSTYRGKTEIVRYLGVRDLDMTTLNTRAIAIIQDQCIGGNKMHSLLKNSSIKEVYVDPCNVQAMVTSCKKKKRKIVIDDIMYEKIKDLSAANCDLRNVLMGRRYYYQLSKIPVKIEVENLVIENSKQARDWIKKGKVSTRPDPL